MQTFVRIVFLAALVAFVGATSECRSDRGCPKEQFCAKMSNAEGTQREGMCSDKPKRGEKCGSSRNGLTTKCMKKKNVCEADGCCGGCTTTIRTTMATTTMATTTMATTTMATTTMATTTSATTTRRMSTQRETTDMWKQQMWGGDFKSLLETGSPKSGSATLVRHGLQTTVTISTWGLESGTYKAHLHNNTCSDNNGGPHYLSNTYAEEANVNSIWLAMPTVGSGPDAHGEAESTVRFSVPISALEGSLSVVIHNTPTVTSGSGPKYLCADLKEIAYQTLKPGFSNEGAQGENVRIMSRSKMQSTMAATGIYEDGTEWSKMKFKVKGLKYGNTYPTHVHNLPCDVLSSGSHYVRDISCVGREKECGPTAQTEYWPGPIGCTKKNCKNGRQRVRGAIEHTSRAGAQAVTIHDPNNGNARLACWTLVNVYAEK